MPARRAATLRYWAANSPHPTARAIRLAHAGLRRFTLPAPRVIVLPYLWLFLALRNTLHFLRRVLVAEPLLKAYCTRHGKGVTTGIFVPWVVGRGELILGDHVHISGKLNVTFAARYVERPRLTIGDHADLAHDASFVVGREIRLGSHVQVGGGVSFRDAGGHHTDPELRRTGAPPDEADVKPIVVHDNVWIGAGVMVLPGTEIGEGSIVAARSVVSGVVPPYTIVAGNPARRIGTLTPPADRGHLAPRAASVPPAPPPLPGPADPDLTATPVARNP